MMAHVSQDALGSVVRRDQSEPPALLASQRNEVILAHQVLPVSLALLAIREKGVFKDCKAYKVFQASKD